LGSDIFFAGTTGGGEMTQHTPRKPHANPGFELWLKRFMFFSDFVPRFLHAMSTSDLHDYRLFLAMSS